MTGASCATCPTCVPVDDPTDPRLRDYTSLADPGLRRVREPAEGLFIAEGEKVIRRALAAGHPVRSLLLAERWLAPLAGVLATLQVPVYVAPADVLETVTGYPVHRGALAAMGRLPLPSPGELLARTRRVLLLEDLNDPTNLGAVLRSAAALGMDAALLTPRCADPLYRRAVKVSMGAVFALPYARFPRWPDCFHEVRAAGFSLLALTPDPAAVPLPQLDLDPLGRCALMLGGEGPGLSDRALAAADLHVRIPMAPAAAEVDSLNVAAAAAVACYALASAPRAALTGPGPAPRPRR